MRCCSSYLCSNVVVQRYYINTMYNIAQLYVVNRATVDRNWDSEKQLWTQPKYTKIKSIHKLSPHMIFEMHNQCYNAKKCSKKLFQAEVVKKYSHQNVHWIIATFCACLKLTKFKMVLFFLYWTLKSHFLLRSRGNSFLSKNFSKMNSHLTESGNCNGNCKREF